MLQDLIDNQPAHATDKRSDQHSVLIVSHRPNRGSGTHSGADSLSGAFHGVTEPVIGSLNMLIRPEGLVEIQVPDKIIEGGRRTEHLSQHLWRQLASGRLGWRRLSR